MPGYSQARTVCVRGGGYAGRVCVCVCMYVRASVRVFMRVCVCVGILGYKCLYGEMIVCASCLSLCVCMCVCICLCMCACAQMARSPEAAHRVIFTVRGSLHGGEISA